MFRRPLQRAGVCPSCNQPVKQLWSENHLAGETDDDEIITAQWDLDGTVHNCDGAAEELEEAITVVQRVCLTLGQQPMVPDPAKHVPGHTYICHIEGLFYKVSKTRWGEWVVTIPTGEQRTVTLGTDALWVVETPHR